MALFVEKLLESDPYREPLSRLFRELFRPDVELNIPNKDLPPLLAELLTKSHEAMGLTENYQDPFDLRKAIVHYVKESLTKAIWQEFPNEDCNWLLKGF